MSPSQNLLFELCIPWLMSKSLNSWLDSKRLSMPIAVVYRVYLMRCLCGRLRWGKRDGILIPEHLWWFLGDMTRGEMLMIQWLSAI